MGHCKSHLLHRNIRAHVTIEVNNQEIDINELLFESVIDKFYLFNKCSKLNKATIKQFIESTNQCMHSIVDGVMGAQIQICQVFHSHMQQQKILKQPDSIGVTKHRFSDLP